MKNSMIGPLKNRIEIELKDERGDIAIEKISDFEFVVWVELEDMGGKFWEKSSTEKNLPAAMSLVTEILQNNIENDFYND